MSLYTPLFTPMVYFQDLDMALGIYATTENRPDHILLIPRPLLLEHDAPVDDNELLRWQICESDNNEVLGACVLRATVDIHRFTLTGHTITSGSLKEKIHENMLLDPQMGDIWEIQNVLKQRPVTRKHAESLIEEVAFDHSIEKPAIEWTRGLLQEIFTKKIGPNGGHYRYDTHTLYFHKAFMTDVQVLHEAAHPVDFKTKQKKLHDWVPAHGPRFVEIFHSVVRTCLPPRAQKSVDEFIRQCDARDLTAKSFLAHYPTVEIIGASPVFK